MYLCTERTVTPSAMHGMILRTNDNSTIYHWFSLATHCFFWCFASSSQFQRCEGPEKLDRRCNRGGIYRRVFSLMLCEANALHTLTPCVIWGQNPGNQKRHPCTYAQIRFSRTGPRALADIHWSMGRQLARDWQLHWSTRVLAEKQTQSH